LLPEGLKVMERSLGFLDMLSLMIITEITAFFLWLTEKVVTLQPILHFCGETGRAGWRVPQLMR